ncbi:MAG: PD-(D/E)XK nuclease family protein [Betaproteobacteria bacterium]
MNLENNFLTRQEFHAGIERVLHEIATDRETQTRRWEQQQRLWEDQTERWKEQAVRWNQQDFRWTEQAERWKAEDFRWAQQKQLWKEQSERWKEQAERWSKQDLRWAQEDQRWEELAADRKAQDERINQRFERLEGDLQQIKLSIGALGARWGLSAEESFRSALAGILTESYGVTVLNISFQDSEGKVFGRPDQVEMDIVVTNGVCMAIEIKSSVDKQAIYLFDRKVQVYSEREGRTVNRKVVISPMVDSRAFRVAKELGIEVFTRSDDEALFRRTEQTS